jgi:hypothetical protein
MTHKLTSAKTGLLNSEMNLGWVHMPKFGEGYLQYLSTKPGDEPAPAATKPEITAEDMVRELYTQPEQTGWTEIAAGVRQSLQQSFWMAMTAVTCTGGLGHAHA